MKKEARQKMIEKIRAHENEFVTLRLSYAYIDDGNILPLINAIAQNPLITKLDLSFNQIGDLGAIQLSQLEQLVWLNLRCNKISEPGARALATNQSLENLVLDLNFAIGDDTAIYLAKTAKNLKKLGLLACSVSIKTKQMVGDILHGNLVNLPKSLAKSQLHQRKSLFIRLKGSDSCAY